MERKTSERIVSLQDGRYVNGSLRISNELGAVRVPADPELKMTSFGVLDRLTILRFAHMSRQATSGGVEAYLWNLNRVLLERNQVRILQMYLAPDGVPAAVETEQLGRGEIVWIPSILTGVSAEQMSYAQRLKTRLCLGGETRLSVNHDALLSILVDFEPEIALFHWLSEDSQVVIDHLVTKNIPFAVINHFDNSRLTCRMARRQIREATAIGGVSSIDIPNFLKDAFVDLSDGMDTEFFHPRKAVPLAVMPQGDLILLPSRMCEQKGHLDAVKALSILARRGRRAILALAGREGSTDFGKRLRRVISKEGVQDRVMFLGELCPMGLRNWYGASNVVVLPSHSEGLGRVLLEAQAMEKPVLAYDVGGVRAACHDGASGFLVRKGDIEGLARRLEELLEDPAKRSQMGQRGREFVVCRFSLDALAIRHERFYAGIRS